MQIRVLESCGTGTRIYSRMLMTWELSWGRVNISCTGGVMVGQLLLKTRRSYPPCRGLLSYTPPASQRYCPPAVNTIKQLPTLTFRNVLGLRASAIGSASKCTIRCVGSRKNFGPIHAYICTSISCRGTSTPACRSSSAIVAVQIAQRPVLKIVGLLNAAQR